MSWRCTCEPIAAAGMFRSGRWHYLLHGPSCGRPLLRRQTLVYRLTGERREDAA